MKTWEITWEIGKTYQLEDYQGFVNDDYTNNIKIYNKIGYSEFKVVEIDVVGRVLQIVVGDDYFTANDLELTFIFRDEDLQYFNLVNSLPETKSSPDEVVIAWLDKLYYVLNNDTTADTAIHAGHVSLRLSTDTVDICGSEAIHMAINARYDQLQEVNRHQLKAKREELLAELAEIDKQLNIK